MAIDANSYGSAAQVATLTPNWANASGVFDTTTQPKLASVETWIDQVSSVLNSVLRELGFVTPIVDADAKRTMDLFVNEEVAAIVEGVRGSGRFGPQAPGKGSAKGRQQIILEDARMFLKQNQVGLETLGATRDSSVMNSLAFQAVDGAGNAVEPWFKRSDFGEG